MPSKKEELMPKIASCIEERIRPFIQMDGGDIEIVELTDDMRLRVRLHGSCEGCMASSFTLQYGVQAAINEEFPEEDIILELIDENPDAVPHEPPMPGMSFIEEPSGATPDHNHSDHAPGTHC